MFQNTPVQSLQQQRLLLQIEYDEERQSFQKQAEATGLGRRLKRGDAWYPLRIGKSYYNSLNQRCVEVIRTTDQDIEHNFEPGRPVVFFSLIEEEVKKKQHLKFFGFTGNVSYIDGDRMVVSVPDNAHIADVRAHQTSGYNSLSTRPVTARCSMHSNVSPKRRATGWHICATCSTLRR